MDISPKSLKSSAPVSFGLAGRVCVVTGGAHGIGEACIRRCAREDAKVLMADIGDQRGTALAQELGGLFVHCDVGEKAQVDALAAQTLAAHGRNLNRLTGDDVLGELPHHRVTPVNQHEARHVDRAFVVRNHHRQKIQVGLARVSRAMPASIPHSKLLFPSALLLPVAAA